MDKPRVYLLGVPIDPIRLDGAVRRIMTMLEKDQQQHVMTPNSEMLVEATRNKRFFSVLQAADLNLPDSVGLQKMAVQTGQLLPERVTGVDTVTALCAQLPANVPVFLLGAADGVAAEAAAALKKINPSLTIAGCYGGSPRPEDADDIITRINTVQPQLLLVAYGAPQQDLWLHDHLAEMPSVRVAIGVGGTFDFLAGRIDRAPAWFRRYGLEWLWRLLKQPSRWRRIWNAVVVFPALVRKYGRSSPFGDLLP